MVPLEVCTVPSGQIVRKQIPPHKMNDVLTFSKKTPDERFEIIRRGIQVNYRPFGCGTVN
jgi:eukaryotic translation initiation factor 2C